MTRYNVLESFTHPTSFEERVVVALWGQSERPFSNLPKLFLLSPQQWEKKKKKMLCMWHCGQTVNIHSTPTGGKTVICHAHPAY